MSEFISKADKYDKRLLEGRVNAEAAILGLMMNDISILTDYNLTSDFFITTDGLFLFKIMEALNKKGITEITDFDILGLSEKIHEKFNDLGGMKLVENMKSAVEVGNTNAYIDTIYKHYSILQIADKGFNLTNEIEFNGKKVVPIQLFKNFNSEQIRDFYDNFVNEISVFSLENGVKKSIFDIDDDFLKSCEEGQQLGYMFDTAGVDINGKPIYIFPSISKNIGGYSPATLNCIAGYSNVGKSTIINSIIFSMLSKGLRVLMITNEQEEKVFKVSYTLWILCNKLRYYNITRQKLTSGNLTEDDKVMLKKAQEIWRDEFKGNLHFVEMNDANMKVVVKLIREYKIKHQIDMVVYDTFKADFESNQDADWKSLVRDSRLLHKTVKRYNIVGLCSMQLQGGTKGKLFLNETTLSGAKAIKEILQTLLLFRATYNEEFDENDKKHYCIPFNRERIGSKWISKAHTINKDNTHRMLFVDKAREGNTSENTGEAYILRFDGSKGIFNEECKCKPKHTTIV